MAMSIQTSLALTRDPLLQISASRKRRRISTGTSFLGTDGALLAVILWAVAIFHPPHGLDLPICWCKATTGLPCPGCGLMRSVSCTARGMFSEAWHYHPFGPIWLAVATNGAGVCMLPRRFQDRIRAWRNQRRRLCKTAYVALITAFLAYGVLRVLAHFGALLPLFRPS